MIFYTNETKLLVETAKMNYKEVDWQFIQSISEIDWDKFVEMAVKHKILPIVERNLKMIMKETSSSFVPQNCLVKMKLLLHLIQRRRNLIDSEMIRLSQFFEMNNVKVVLLKGYSLNEIYPGNSLRQYGDIDLLIRLQDVSLLHDILIKQQYTYDGGDVTVGVLKDIAQKAVNCIGHYTKTDAHSEVNIDVHKADHFNIWNLKDFYNHSVSGQYGYQYLDLVDRFIFSCFHAWHHYPRVVNVRLDTVQSTLRDYMEIRELYLYLKKNEMITILLDRIKELKCEEIINNMLYLSERFYSSFCDRNEVITCRQTIQNDYEDSILISFFERRVFYPKIEQELLLNYYKHTVADHSTESFLECNFYDEAELLERENNVFWISNPVYYSTSDIFYDEPYGTCLSKDIELRFSFSVGWNNKNLIVKMDILSNQFVLGKESYYNPIQDSIKFIFDDDWSKVFTLQLKESGHHKLFLERKSVFEMENIDDNTTYFKKKDNEYEIITNIPWKYVNKKPIKGEKIFFYFIIERTNRKMRCYDTILFNDKENRLLELK